MAYDLFNYSCYGSRAFYTNLSIGGHIGQPPPKNMLQLHLPLLKALHLPKRIIAGGKGPVIGKGRSSGQMKHTSQDGHPHWGKMGWKWADKMLTNIRRV